MDDAEHCLKRGSQYPYDAPLGWWEDVANTQPPEPNDWATQAARGILWNLCDRRGIKDGFGHVDDAVRAEIVQSIADIIRAAAPTGAAP